MSLSLSPLCPLPSPPPPLHIILSTVYGDELQMNQLSLSLSLALVPYLSLHMSCEQNPPRPPPAPPAADKSGLSSVTITPSSLTRGLWRCSTCARRCRSDACGWRSDAHARCLHERWAGGKLCEDGDVICGAFQVGRVASPICAMQMR